MIANFSGVTGGSTDTYGPKVEIWGTLDSNAFRSTITSLVEEDEGFAVVTYTQVSESTFVSSLTDALAEDRGPDAVVISSSLLATLRSKLIPIPYESFPIRTFRDNYVEGAEIFARTDGVYAIPFAVDPLILYWNRDLFSAAGLVQPPDTWESFVSRAVPALTKRSTNRKLTQSAVAFGEFDNVKNAKDVMLMLALQAGSEPVTESEDKYLVTIDIPEYSNTSRPFTSAMQFYLEFSNINSSRYSWDVAQTDDKSAFLGERLAMYFGRASELSAISAGNPNLNFDIETVPQGADSNIKRTYGEFYGLAMVRGGANSTGTYMALSRIAAVDIAPYLSQNLRMMPVIRSVIADGFSDPYQTIFAKAVPGAHSWLDPNPDQSDAAFSNFVSSVTSNQQYLSTAVSTLINRLAQIF